MKIKKGIDSTTLKNKTLASVMKVMSVIATVVVILLEIVIFWLFYQGIMFLVVGLAKGFIRIIASNKSISEIIAVIGVVVTPIGWAWKVCTDKKNVANEKIVALQYIAANLSLGLTDEGKSMSQEIKSLTVKRLIFASQRLNNRELNTALENNDFLKTEKILKDEYDKHAHYWKYLYEEIIGRMLFLEQGRAIVQFFLKRSKYYQSLQG